MFHRNILPVPGVIVHAHEGTCTHPVNIQRSLQMIDFMLEYARIPAVGLNRYRFGSFVQGIDTNGKRSTHHSREAAQA